MENLKNRSLELNERVDIYSIMLRRKQTKCFWNIHSGTYNMRNGILAFKVGKFLYVTCVKKGDVDILNKYGFKEANFDIPFSGVNYPIEPTLKQKWEKIIGHSIL